MIDHKKILAKYKTWQVDLFVLLLLLIINPLAHNFFATTAKFTPDGFAYLAFAKSLFNNGQLYLEGWGHVDGGLILPPLYPFFIGLLEIFSDNTLKNAEIISASFMLLATIPIFLYLRQMSNYLYAIVGVVLIQINFYYIYFGPTPYTESSFILILAICFWLTYKLETKRDNYLSLAICLGIFSGLLFFSRQIGITYIFFLFAWYSMQLFFIWDDKSQFRSILKKSSLVILFWAIIVTPYASLLYIQAEKSPLTQSFRMNHYVIKTVDSSAFAEFQEINNIEADHYSTAFYKRRLLRKLLPDGSEMLSHTDFSKLNDCRENSCEEVGLFSRSYKLITNPELLAKRFIKNVGYLVSPLGLIGFSLFILLLISPFIIKSNKISRRSRLIIPSFMLVYFLSLAIIGDLVSRYSHVLYPFPIIYILIECFIIFSAIKRLKIKKVFSNNYLLIAILIAFLLPPRYFFEEKLYAFKDLDLNSWDTFKKVTEKQAPIFTLAPSYAFFSGGSFRILPNDSLENVVKYANKTGVEWLIVSSSPLDQKEIGSYIFSDWLNKPKTLENYSDLVEYCCSVDSEYFLYKINSPP